jgi:hypothetical protein
MKRPLDRELAAAAPQAIPALHARRKQVQGALDLENAMIDAIHKIVGIAEAQGGIRVGGCCIGHADTLYPMEQPSGAFDASRI